MVFKIVLWIGIIYAVMASSTEGKRYTIKYEGVIGYF